MGRRRKKSKQNEMKGIGKDRKWKEEKGKEMERNGRRGKERKEGNGKKGKEKMQIKQRKKRKGKEEKWKGRERKGTKERYSSSGLMCAMDFIYCLSHDCPLDIDHDDFVSIRLLSRTTTMVVGDWCFTNYAHGWWVSI